MKEAIGGTWLFQIVIVFIFIFAGYMCLSINHSKAFSIKSEIVESLSRNGGVNKDEIANILSKASYRTRGSCEKYNTNLACDSNQEGCWYGYNREGNKTSGNDATFCIRKLKYSGVNSYELPNQYYYQVRVFYQLDLPIFNSLFSFTVKGDTNVLFDTESNKNDISERQSHKDVDDTLDEYDEPGYYDNDDVDEDDETEEEDDTDDEEEDDEYEDDDVGDDNLDDFDIIDTSDEDDD